MLAPAGAAPTAPAAPTTPFVGREFELDQLRHALERARSSLTPQFVTVLGAPGMGKTRLAAELAAGAADVRCITGSCAEYGEEAPLAPVREAFAAAGVASLDDAARLLQDEPDAERILGALQPLFGGETTDPEGLRWGIRRVLEKLAQERPLLLVLDNVDRAGPPLFDVLEHVTEVTHSVALVVVCLAQPELLERRADWTQATRHAFVLQLEPLVSEHAETLLEALGGAATTVRDRILDASGGNPLFLEQLVAVGRSTGGLSFAPTLDALLAARLELLPDHERRALEHASVLGLEFHADDITAIDERLGSTVFESLVTKGLLAPAAGRLRFHHPLIREVAYREAPRDLRGRLHERLADAAAMPDIRAFHLERAIRDCNESGRVDDRARELAIEASGLLRDAGLRALGRAETATGADLLDRATRLLDPSDPRRIELLPELGSALVDVGEGTRGTALLEEAAERAQELGDAPLRAHARLAILWTERFVGGSGDWARAATQEAEGLLRVLQDSGDDRGLARAWNVLAVLLEVQGQLADSRTLGRKALDHARRAGDGRMEADGMRVLGDALVWGPTPVDQAIAELEQALAGGPTLATESGILARLGALLAMRGDAAAAHDALARASRVVMEVGLDPAPVHYWSGVAELLLDEPSAAEHCLRLTRTLIEAMDAPGWSTAPGFLGEALVRLGRHDDAARRAGECREAAADHDAQAQFLWRSVQAKVLAARSQHDQAIALARAALALLDGTDAIGTVGDAEHTLAQVLRAAGDTAEASAAAARATEAYVAKGDRSSERRARALAAQLAGEPLAQTT